MLHQSSLDFLKQMFHQYLIDIYLKTDFVSAEQQAAIIIY